MNPFDWIGLKNATADEIRRAVIEHTKITRPEVPETRKVTVYRHPPDLLVVAFPDGLPPYEFTNLVSWLPYSIRSARESAGWFTSPGDRIRYGLVVGGGDTLVGCSADGKAVEVYLPDTSLCEISRKVDVPAESELGDLEELASFTITVDANPDFGNPEFRITHPKNTQW